MLSQADLIFFRGEVALSFATLTLLVNLTSSLAKWFLFILSRHLTLLTSFLADNLTVYLLISPFHCGRYLYIPKDDSEEIIPVQDEVT